MTLRDMLYLVTIAEERSITKAAQTLFVAQPALSQCVQKVERELGTTLFVRMANGVLPTVEGSCFLNFAKNTLAEQTVFQHKLADIENGESGEINLGFTGTQAAYVLPDILPPFKQRHPKILIHLIEATSNDIETMVVSGEVDVGIIHPPVLNEKLDAFEISEDHMVIVPRCGSRYQPFIYYQDGKTVPYLNIEFLREEPILLTQPWQRSRMTIDEILRRASITPKVMQITRNISTLDALAQVDYATALIPEKQLSANLRRRGYFQIDEKYDVPYTFAAATLRGGYLSRAAQNLVQLLHELSHTF